MFLIVIIQPSFFFNPGSLPVGYSDFGQGENLILRSNVRCDGDELSLGECDGQTIGQHFCSHNQDAGVICFGTYIS